MTEKEKLIQAVPTNIITGFLGAGKTSTILNLLSQKPSDERWAVLVNEFGEIGIDGSLIQGQFTEQNGVFVREVPGGCMCCAAGLPMQIVLNQLLTIAQPDRLLIEPTGLGHPHEVLQVLSDVYYKDALKLQQILTLVDATVLNDERYTDHEIFNQQIAIADVVIGNKSDQYGPEDKARLEAYVELNGSTDTQVVFTVNGELSTSYLAGSTAAVAVGHAHTQQAPQPLASDQPIPECGYLKATNHGEGFDSIGWRFKPEIVFKHNNLYSFLNGVEAERMKAVFTTDQGIFGYNLAAGALSEIQLDECTESRVEIIAYQINEYWEKQLLACIIA